MNASPVIGQPVRGTSEPNGDVFPVIDARGIVTGFAPFGLAGEYLCFDSELREIDLEAAGAPDVFAVRPRSVTGDVPVPR